MNEAISHVHTAMITYAARDSEFDGHSIHAGEYLALLDGALIENCAETEELFSSLSRAVQPMNAEFITVYYGADVSAEDAEKTGAFINSFSPNAILVVYPSKEEVNKDAVRGAMRISYALSDAFKHQFSEFGMEFSMGLDHGHIMGTKNLSDNNYDSITWFGSCIYKAMRICNECARPFYVGVSGSIYHNLDEDLRIAERRILGIRKKVEIWTKVSYQYENVKKHLYQTNHKISFDEE
jgi:hypothetical protein